MTFIAFTTTSYVHCFIFPKEEVENFLKASIAITLLTVFSLHSSLELSLMLYIPHTNIDF